MTANEAKQTIMNFQELAIEYAEKGDIDAVANINTSIVYFVTKRKDILSGKQDQEEPSAKSNCEKKELGTLVNELIACMRERLEAVKESDNYEDRCDIANAIVRLSFGKVDHYTAVQITYYPEDFE